MKILTEFIEDTHKSIEPKLEHPKNITIIANNLKQGLQLPLVLEKEIRKFKLQEMTFKVKGMYVLNMASIEKFHTVCNFCVV